MLCDLPPECLGMVTRLVSPTDRCMLSSTCRKMRREIPDRAIDGRGYFSSLDRYLRCRSAGCGLSRGLARELAAAGNDEGLLMAVGDGCPFDHTLLAAAAREGRMDILLWARRLGGEFHADVMAAAAAGGRAHVIRWLRLNGCPALVAPCALLAAKAGSVPALEELARIRGSLEGATEACVAAVAAGESEAASWILRYYHVDMHALRAAEASVARPPMLGPAPGC